MWPSPSPRWTRSPCTARATAPSCWEDIINGTTQVSEGIAQGMGIDIKALLSGMLGGKVAAESQEPPAPVAVVVPAEEPAPLAAGSPRGREAPIKQRNPWQ